MKKLALRLLLVTSLCCCFSVYAKENNSMMPPKPIDNKVFESLVGTWRGQNDMMGTKMEDRLKVSWSLNHQFLIMELQSKSLDNPSIHYEGLGVFGVDQDGHVKTWWFDSWGSPSVSTGTGITKDNKLVINNGNAVFNEERTFHVKGNEMTMHAKGTMQMNGKETTFDQNGVYRK